jgi:hypothetical protein
VRGGYGAGDHGTLADRRSARDTPAPAAPSPPHAVEDSPARHCFVDGQPSLLVEWRRASLGWEGRVLTLVWLDAVGWTTIERWLPAAVITPAEGAVGHPPPAG